MKTGMFMVYKKAEASVNADCFLLLVTDWNTLRAEAKFSLCELACENQLLFARQLTQWKCSLGSQGMTGMKVSGKLFRGQ